MSLVRHHVSRLSGIHRYPAHKRCASLMDGKHGGGMAIGLRWAKWRALGPPGRWPELPSSLANHANHVKAAGLRAVRLPNYMTTEGCHCTSEKPSKYRHRCVCRLSRNSRAISVAAYSGHLTEMGTKDIELAGPLE